uniref:Uncharacterized protein n=1 Tax=Arundo donax TaxID=35708 RepID=A0A0A9CGT8_ARUDO
MTHLNNKAHACGHHQLNHKDKRLSQNKSLAAIFYEHKNGTVGLSCWVRNLKFTSTKLLVESAE